MGALWKLRRGVAEGFLPGQSSTVFCGAESGAAAQDNGDAQVQFIIKVVAIPVNFTSLASLALNMRRFASFLWESGLVSSKKTVEMPQVRKISMV